MGMQQCPNGHLYDASQHSTCPFCANNTVGKTMPLNGDMVSTEVKNTFPETQSIDGPLMMNEPVRANSANNIYPSDGNRMGGVDKTAYVSGVGETMSIGSSYKATEYIDPARTEKKSEHKAAWAVRGWLVCLDGSHKGVDFRIHGEKNTIGRGTQNDIVLDFDNTISKAPNVTIAYDNRNNKFYLYQNEARNNIYINDHLLLVPEELHDYDVIELGKTKLIFRSMCNDNFVWEEREKKD